MTSIIEQSGLIETLSPIFENINEDNWDQKTGTLYEEDFDSHGQLSPGVACCVGAHIANSLDIFDESDDNVLFNYSEGRDYVLEQLQQVFPEMKYYMMCAIFHCAGSPPDPFNTEDWEFGPSIVLENMKCIENMPPVPESREFLLDYYNRPEVLNWFHVESYRIMMRMRAKKS